MNVHKVRLLHQKRSSVKVYIKSMMLVKMNFKWEKLRLILAKIKLIDIMSLNLLCQAQVVVKNLLFKLKMIRNQESITFLQLDIMEIQNNLKP